MASRIDEIISERKKKMEGLTALEIELFPARSQKDITNGEVVNNFAKYEGKSFNLTGRIVAWREHGKLIFGQILDQSGKIQLFIRGDELEPTSKAKQTIGFGDLHLLDIGDFVQVFGEIVKTKTGEISVQVKHIKLLTKSLRPLPEKWVGLKDMEIAFRKRYLDFIVNRDKVERFIRKSKFWEANRKFMKDHGFIEVETPILESMTGGADARPFVTHMNALDQDFFLRISTELFEKRLIGAGFEKIYTLGPNFRNEGIDDEHLPEFYQLEWYWAYADYNDGMKLIKEMYRYVASEVYGRTKFTSRGMTYDLADEWVEIDYAKVIKEKLGIDIFTSTDGAMMKVVKAKGLKLAGDINRARLIDNLWKLIRKEIAGPAFLINEPKFMSPLAKSKPENPELTERFHVILAGSELGNGYSELNNPMDQRARFEEQQKAREEGDEEAQMMDVDFVEMLEYGMPPTCGWGHSERLFWFLEDVSAREGTLFPTMRVKKDEQEKGEEE
ncbi:lysine--tRNA ligase [Candidatus Collierbacteria bacterium]|nr:lysine--tRNA ligase [Candidatus Collierbacteria bacterium]